MPCPGGLKITFKEGGESQLIDVEGRKTARMILWLVIDYTLIFSLFTYWPGGFEFSTIFNEVKNRLYGKCKIRDLVL